MATAGFTALLSNLTHSTAVSVPGRSRVPAVFTRLCSASAVSSFLLISRKLMGNYEADIRAIIFWRPKQTLLGGRGWSYHPCHPLLSTAFVLKFSLLPLSFLVGSFLFFSHLRLYLIDKARIPPTEQHG